MPVRVNIDSQSIDNRGRTLAAPDNKTVFWSNPHDMKIEMYAVLKAVLECLGKTDVPIIQDGAFLPSELTDEDGNSRTVITIGRSSDLGFRRAIGDHFFTVTTPSNLISDPCNELPDGTTVSVFAEWSTEQCDVTISDLDPTRANEMYQIVKTIMIFAGEQFRNTLGYEDFKRVNGTDQTVQIDAPGAGIVFMKVLTYTGTHRDEALALPYIVNLVEQRQAANSTGSDTGPITATAI